MTDVHHQTDEDGNLTCAICERLAAKAEELDGEVMALRKAIAYIEQEVKRAHDELVAALNAEDVDGAPVGVLDDETAWACVDEAQGILARLVDGP